MEQQVRFSDLREWLREVESIGELKVVEGAIRDEDIGMIAAMLAPSTTSAAVLFDSIPGYPKGYRVLANIFNTYQRVALTMGLPLDWGPFELSSKLLEITDNLKPIPPVWVNDGPVMENVQMGKEVNLQKFPVPKWHEDDGGRYIGTGSYDITRDPDEAWVNLGTYRVMLHDERHVGFYISPGKHGYLMREKYYSRNQPCPVAVVAGGDPLLYLASSTDVPYGVCEYDWAGGFRGRPYPVFKGRVTGLPLPADAEIILEGFSHPNERRPEGPYGEWPGYYASGARDEPVITVEAVYHRNDPIISGMATQRPPGSQKYRAVFRSASLKQELDKAGIPGVTQCWCHEVGGTRLLLAVAIKQQYVGHARQAGHVAAQCRAGAYLGRYVIVVDDDIDVTNLNELIWAMCTRSDPETSIDIVRRAWSGRIDPRISPEDKEQGKLCNSRAIIDATKPWEWINQFPKVTSLSPEMLKKTKEKWGFLLGETMQ